MLKKRFIWSFFNWKISVQIPFLLFTCFAIAVCSSLAHWQWQRAQQADVRFQAYQLQKSRPESALSQSPENYQKIALSGDIKGFYLLDNKIQQGIAGWHVLAEVQTTKLRLLVNLGWQAKQKKLILSEELPQRISVQGLIKKPEDGFMLQDAEHDPNWPKLMQQIDIALLNTQRDIPLLPYVLYAENKVGGLIPAPIQLENKYYMHMGYAAQWALIALAGLICFLYISRSEYKEYERKQKKLVA